LEGSAPRSPTATGTRARRASRFDGETFASKESYGLLIDEQPGGMAVYNDAREVGDWRPGKVRVLLKSVRSFDLGEERASI